MTVKEMRFAKLERERVDVQRLSIKVKYLCMSSVCRHHHSINGQILDYNEVLKVYQPDLVEDDCNCAPIQILVDENGEPLHPNIVNRVRAHKSRFN